MQYRMANEMLYPDTACNLQPEDHDSQLARRNVSQRIAIYGYGSLVNQYARKDLTNRVILARLSGWARQWAQCMDTAAFLQEHFGKICALTVEPTTAELQICGALLLDEAESLQNYDAR